MKIVPNLSSIVKGEDTTIDLFGNRVQDPRFNHTVTPRPDPEERVTYIRSRKSVRPDPGLLGRGRCLTSLSPYPDRTSKNFCPLFKTSPIGEG